MAQLRIVVNGLVDLLPRKYLTLRTIADNCDCYFGGHRIRHYGLLASGVKAENLVLARKLLDVAPPAPEPEDIAAETPTPLKPCPCCGSPMHIIEVLKAGKPARHRPPAMPDAVWIDTS